MPNYRYKALNPHGEIFDGQMEAASEAELVARLQDQGHLPMETQLADGGAIGGSSWRNLLQQRPLQGAALLQFTQQLATLLGAGQPLDRALSILLGLPEDERSRRAITDIRDVVRGGAPLSTALERQHGLFSRLYVNMVRAGEAGGSLHETLQRLADYLERSRALQGKVINALVYPAILLVVVAVLLLCRRRGAAVRADVRKPGRGAAVVHQRGTAAGPVRARLVGAAAGGARRAGAVLRTQGAATGVPAGAGWLAAAASRHRPPARRTGNRAAGAHAGHPAAQWRAAAGALGIARNVLGNRALAADVKRPPMK
jgi:general secretion pathway protein F